MNEQPTTIDLETLESVTGGTTLPTNCPWKDIWDRIRGRGGSTQPQPVPDRGGTTS